MTEHFLAWEREPGTGFHVHRLSDGRKITLGASPNGNPPGKRGLAVATPSVWIRVNDRPWIKTPCRSLSEAVEYAVNPRWVDSVDILGRDDPK